MQNKHFSFIAILGATNVGKSTLVNRLVGQKISIVSPKVQTTRSRVRGLINEGNTQLALVDTPGIFSPHRRLDRAMIAAAWAETDDSDRCLFILDAKKGIQAEEEKILDKLIKSKSKFIIVVNKMDAVKPDKLMVLLEKLNDIKTVESVFCISALNGENIAELKNYLLDTAPQGEWLFPDGLVSDLPESLFCAEITREKLFMYLRQELPYQLMVDPVSFKRGKNGLTIEQNIIVSKAAHRPIVLGNKGTMIKKVGEAARKEMIKQLGYPVRLFLFVQVKENWTEDKARYKTWGLDFNA
ncbi:MAG: GTPase Era [Alphaproteobacteria bacterium]|nr:GTPase Era [Alphaproteobacteria bacterium]